MADGRIRMTVLEGTFTGLQGVGIPLPFCIHLQDLGLQFECAQWTAKQSNTGYSISFFWPVHDCSTFSVNLPMGQMSVWPSSDTSSISHLIKNASNTNPNAEDFAAPDLLSCESISYEMHQNIPGVMGSSQNVNSQKLPKYQLPRMSIPKISTPNILYKIQ